MWFIYALVSTISWGAADLFYKKGADAEDKYSHLKTSAIVGVVMGAHAIFTIIANNIDYDPINLLIYLPVSLCYILSMTIGYLGLRYLMLSISSPIQNSSGAIVTILCLIFLDQMLDLPSAVGVMLICSGIFVLGVLEKKKMETEIREEDRKYQVGFKAFFLPIAYCFIDALGTFFDAYYLDDYRTTPLRGVTERTFEDVANISYELTFLLAAILIFIYIKIIRRQRFGFLEHKNRMVAALFETGGQAAYVYAMSGTGVVAAPMIASYSIVSLILSRIFLKEKLTGKQYAAVAVVMTGIFLLGLAEALAE